MHRLGLETASPGPLIEIHRVMKVWMGSLSYELYGAGEEEKEPLVRGPLLCGLGLAPRAI